MVVVANNLTEEDKREAGGVITDALSSMFTALLQAGAEMTPELKDKYAKAFVKAGMLEQEKA